MDLRKIYLLDTNIISEAIKPMVNENVRHRLEMTTFSSVISATVLYELLKGINVLPDSSKKDKLEKYVTDYVQTIYPIIPYDEHCASIQADIFARMLKNGTPVSNSDCQIAATALANNLIIVTRNTKDFEPIQKEFSLCVENWFEE